MVPADEAGKYNTLADLAIIAKFFNGSWKKNPINVGYFIEYNETEERIDICAHEEDIYIYILESYILKGKKMQSKQLRFLVRE